jgi:molecular chaperone GrpE
MADEPLTDAPVAPAEAETPDPLADLQRERDEFKDRWLRASADFDNYKKRQDRLRREHADQAIENLLQDVLLVVDDFDLALAVESDESAAPYRKGIELIYGKMQELLRRYGVTPIEPLGADFDPNMHQAVMHEESPAHRDGEVIGVLRKGYMINDRLLRPAMVRVAKA